MLVCSVFLSVCVSVCLSVCTVGVSRMFEHSSFCTSVCLSVCQGRDQRELRGVGKVPNVDSCLWLWIGIFFYLAAIKLEKIILPFLLTLAELGGNVLWNNQIIRHCGPMLECMYENWTLSSALALSSSVLSSKKSFSIFLSYLTSHMSENFSANPFRMSNISASSFHCVG